MTFCPAALLHPTRLETRFGFFEITNLSREVQMAILGILSFGYARDSMAVRAAVLRQAGYRVEEAHSPAQCLESIKSDAIDVVLLCHSVPKAEAQLLVSLIRQQRVLLPIVCVSSSDHAAAPEGCIRASNAPIPLVNSLRNAIRKPPAPPGVP